MMSARILVKVAWVRVAFVTIKLEVEARLLTIKSLVSTAAEFRFAILEIPVAEKSVVFKRFAVILLVAIISFTFRTLAFITSTVAWSIIAFTELNT